MIATSTFAPAVAGTLLGYLQERFQSSHLHFVRQPEQITNGWETYIYRFQLGKTADLPEPFMCPLILRVYASMEGSPRLRHEYQAQAAMVKLAYPAPRPLLCDEDDRLFGGPFMIMHEAPGQTLLELMLNRPWRIWGGPAQMAAMHARLHRLPVDGFPASTQPFLGRRLREMGQQIKEYQLRGLEDGFRWLNDRRPQETDSPRIIHLDFHPMNMMFHQDQCSGVLDWGESDVGDRHADVATTMVLMKSAPVDTPNLLQRFFTFAGTGRGLLYRRYFRAYRRRLPLDKRTFRYYMAWAALRRLCYYGMWRHAGPRVTGAKHTSLRYVNAQRVAILQRLFHKNARVSVQL